MMRYNGTKDASSANYVACGIKTNAVIHGEAGTGVARSGWRSRNSAAITYGGIWCHFGGLAASTLIPASSGHHISWGASGGDLQDGGLNGWYQQLAAPDANTASWTIRGLNEVANNNLGVDDLYVYQYSIS